MSKVSVRRAAPPGRSRSASTKDPALGAWLAGIDDFSSLSVHGYSRLIDSPDVANCVNPVADIISNATIQLWKNTSKGDVRVRNELSRFMDIHPYSLGTRQSFMNWIVSYMLTEGDGNATVLPVTRDGYLVDMIPLPGASTYATDNGTGYVVVWQGKEFAPDSVLHFPLRPDLRYPWKGRGPRIQLKDVLQNLRQSAATTNSFLTDKWKPGMVIKVDALADEFSGPDGRKKLLENYIAGQKAGEPWVIPADLMDVIQVKPLSLADLAINDTVQLDKKTVAAAYGVPAFFLGIGSYNEAEYNAFIRKAVIPLANSIAQELTKKLLISPDMYFRVNERKLYSYSLPDLARVADDQYVRGLMDGNEVRDWLGMAPRDGLDKLVMLENYIPADQIGDQKKLSQEGSNGE